MGNERKRGSGARLFLKEHRKAQNVSASEMAHRLGIERESVHRLERESWRVNSAKQAEWASALGITPEDLWRQPGTLSLDSIVRESPEAVKELAADIVRRLVRERQ